uniref:Uncharacterized protein n=1 Tax=Biomphalaria glabrata TaxID=6526 RepID=A0A2C9KC80_BIOGL
MILTILLTVIIYLCRTGSGLTNLFNYSGSNNADTIYGWTCLTYTEYVPTCGWKLILYSSHPLTGMAGGAEFYTYTQVDSYTFHLNAVSKYADLTNIRPNCPDIQVIGSFGSSIPSLTVNWYCVCNQTTNSICLAVAGTALETASTTATSTSQTASHISSGLTNLFNYSSSNNADTIYGWTCLTYTEYVPTCGWKLILYSSHPLTGMAGGAEFYTYTQVDSYTFHLNAVSKYADLTNMRPNCPDIQVIGSFRAKHGFTEYYNDN